MEHTGSGAVATDDTPAWVPDASTARVESPGPGDELPPMPGDDELPGENADGGMGDPNEPPSKADSTRMYNVLEEFDLGDLVQALLAEAAVAPALTEAQLDAVRGIDVYRITDTVAARNSEHALRQAGKARSQPGRPMLVPVPIRNWNPTPVTVRKDTHVQVGA